MVVVYAISLILYYVYLAITLSDYLKEKFKNSESAKITEPDVMFMLMFVALGIVPIVNSLLSLVFIVKHHIDSINKYLKNKYKSN